MASIYKRPGAARLRTRLFQIGVETLERDGWTVRRGHSGKASVRQITKEKVSKTVAIRTSLVTRIAFPRNSTDDGWGTLDDVELVVASSVDDETNPRFAQVHLIEAGELRARFDRAYEARKKAGYNEPGKHGIWLRLYEKEAAEPVSLVGAGAGLDHPAVARVPLDDKNAEPVAAKVAEPPEANEIGPNVRPLSIAQAKRGLALSFGVDESAIKITISS